MVLVSKPQVILLNKTCIYDMILPTKGVFMRIPKRDYWSERGFDSREDWKKWRVEQYRIKTSKYCFYCEEICWGNRTYCSNKCNLLGNIKVSDIGCWEWKKGKNQYGYGLAKDLDDRTQTIGNKMKTSSVHRISYKTFKEEIPKGKFVCHNCDNPCCCNPDHLFLGSPKDNARDALKKGRLATHNLTYRSPKGIPINAKLTIEDVKKIKQRISGNERIIEIAEDYSVNPQCIYSIKNGKTWRDI